jgi:hypothetical protein
MQTILGLAKPGLKIVQGQVRDLVLEIVEIHREPCGILTRFTCTGQRWKVPFNRSSNLLAEG